jgi:hypothetical protein
MNALRLFLVCSLFGGMSAGIASADVTTSQPDSCAYFYGILQTVPHESLSRRHGTYESAWDGKPYQGCEVKFITTDALRAGKGIPTFEAFPDSELYRLGWRIALSIGADGPGSGIFAVEKGPVLCVIRWAQPAYLADSGEIVQSDTLKMTIQCQDE